MQRALVERAKRGDNEAFDALVRSVGDGCMAIAYRILRDADLAEDAVQEALITAWREIRTLRDADRFEPWIHRILTNECYAAATRRGSLRRQLHVVSLDRETIDVQAAIGDRDQLERAFERLTVEQRTVLVFRHYLGLSMTDLAEHLAIPLGTAKSRLHHATAALRASLEADARKAANPQERLA